MTAGGGTAILCKTGAVLHEFLPASEIFRVAEAVLRVFHRLGDYKHKQRNRMKFMIRELGWTAVARGIRPRADRLPPERRGADARDRSAGRPSRSRTGRSRPRRRSATIAARVTRRRVKGRASCRRSCRCCRPGDEAYARWRATNVRPQKQFGFVMAIATVPLGDLTSEQMRVLGELARAYGDGTVRVTMDQDLVFRWVNAATSGSSIGGSRRPASASPRRGPSPTSTSCPGAESCRLAVTQSRGLGRLLEDHLRARPGPDRRGRRRAHQDQRLPERLRPASHRDDRLPGQRAPPRLARRAAVFRHGRRRRRGPGASFARLAAKVPARRIPEVVERLIELYAREHGSRANRRPDFFARVDVARCKQELADLERLTKEDSLPADYVDLGEVSEFNPLVMDGECSA